MESSSPQRLIIKNNLFLFSKIFSTPNLEVEPEHSIASSVKGHYLQNNTFYLLLSWFWSFHPVRPAVTLSTLNFCTEYDVSFLLREPESHS